MSAQATFWAWKQTVDSSAKLVLLALANYADDDDTCWPSKTTVAGTTGLSPRTVQRCLRELEQLHLIEHEDRFRDNGGRSSSAYHLLLLPGGPSHGVSGILEPNQKEEVTALEPGHDDLAQTEMLPDPVIETWETYVKALDRPRAQLTPKHRKWISDAHSAVGVEQTRKAIRGLAASDYHRENGYVGIEYAIVAKRGQTIESRVEQMAAKAPATDGPTAGRQAIARFSPDTQERIYRDANQIRSWLLNQENRGLASAADGSRRHLERMGLRVVFDDNHSFVRFEEIAK